MDRWSSLREWPLLVVAGVALFVIWALVLAAFLLRDEQDAPAQAEAATATATLTPSPTVTATTPPSPAATATAPTATATAPATPPDDPDTPDTLLALLPALADLPEGFVVTREGPLTLDDLAELRPDAAAERARLEGWGFVAAAERQFERPASDAPPGGLTLLAAVAVAFGSPEAAREAAVAGDADARAEEGVDVAEAAIEPLGDFALAATGTLTVDGETTRIAWVIVQLGNRVVTFVGVAPADDALGPTLEIARRTVERLS